MELKRYNVKIRGITPLLMHRGGLANPLDPWAKKLKEISSKRKKSDEDHEEMSFREFCGGMYFDDKAGPYIPPESIEAVVREGAKQHKLGKVVQSSVFCETDTPKLIYKGPRTMDGLWDKGFSDTRRVSLQGSKSLMRTRPRFNSWSVEFTLSVNTMMIDEKDVLTALENAGALKGLGDYKPRYGRFAVVEFTEAKS